jgi:catechol 2,3-dioxygenase-like lactoylglutathione lyase family enzyme
MEDSALGNNSLLGKVESKSHMEWNPLVPELIVSNVATSRQFYVDLLGFTVRFERDDPPFVYLAMGGAQIMLEQTHATQWATATLEFPFGRGINLQIEIDDVDRLHAQIVVAGYSLFRPLRESWYETDEGMAGQREFLVQDPDGYLLRFAQVLESTQKDTP